MAAVRLAEEAAPGSPGEAHQGARPQTTAATTGSGKGVANKPRVPAVQRPALLPSLYRSDPHQRPSKSIVEIAVAIVIGVIDITGFFVVTVAVRRPDVIINLLRDSQITNKFCAPCEKRAKSL